MLTKKQFTSKQLHGAFDVSSEHVTLEESTLAVYEYMKSLNLKASDEDIRNQCVIIVEAQDSAFWSAETIGEWIKPKGPFDDIEEFFMCKAGERIGFKEFSEDFLNYKNTVNAPSSNAKQ